MGPLSGWLMILVLPFVVLWVPLVRSPGFGTLTALDTVLWLLYGLTLLNLASQIRTSGLQDRALRLVIWALLPALFECLGALVYNSESSLLYPALQHLKRFGAAAIIPLAMLTVPRRFIPRIRIAAVVALLIMVFIPLTPLVDLLPVNDSRGGSDVAMESRSTGSLSNPNDFAYVALLTTLIGLSHAAGASGTEFKRRAWAFCAVGAGLAGLVTSASRAGMVASVVAVIYVLTQTSLSHAKRLLAVTVVISTMLIGWQASAIYQGRMAQALDGEVTDASFLARIDAQVVAVRTWINHPLGVGFANMPTATAEYSRSQYFDQVGGSDSIYIDYLAAAGIFGLLSIIMCFSQCWRLVSFENTQASTMYLRAGVLSSFVFGMSTISPASVFVSPFFFALVGLAACQQRDGSLRLVRRA